MNIQTILSETDRRLDILKKSENKFSKELAPHFNLLTPFRIDEVTLSRCLAAILDPNGTHGQGSYFLETFIQRLELPDPPGQLHTAKVTLEHRTIDARRIDIVITFDHWIIGIENKPWAAYLDRQLQDYADYLSDDPKNRKWVLVCLGNETPSHHAIDPVSRMEYKEKRKYKRFSYDEVVEWLTESAYRCQALKVRIYVEQLAEYIRKEINGELDMAEENEIEALIFESEKSLQSALSIANALPGIRRRKLEALLKQLDEHLQRSTLLLGDREEGLLKESAEYGFNILIHKDQIFTLRFAFETPRLNSFYWGISTIEGEIQSQHKAAAEEIGLLMKRFCPGGGDNEFWPWWKYANSTPFTNDHFNWSSSAAPWIKIDDGSLAQMVVHLAENVYGHFEGNEHLLDGKPYK